MAYAEYLRVRRALTIFAIVVTASVLVALVAFYSSSDHGIRLDPGHAPPHMEFSILLVIAAFSATIMATFFGTSLGCERSHIALAWTKPVPRERFALAYFGVDALALLAAFAFTVIVGEVLLIASLGLLKYITLDAHAVPYVALALGETFAFYAVLQALSVNLGGRAGAIAGLAWPVGFVLVGLAAAPFPHVIHAIVVVLNFVNPLAYATSFSEGSSSSVLPLTLPMRIAAVWLLAAVAATVATLSWKRLED